MKKARVSDAETNNDVRSENLLPHRLLTMSVNMKAPMRGQGCNVVAWAGSQKSWGETKAKKKKRARN